MPAPVQVRGPAQVQSRSIIVSGDWHAQLQLNLNPQAPPAPAAPAGSAVGADAVAAKVDLPAKVTLAFGRVGLASIALTQAKFTAYGTSATLKRAQLTVGQLAEATFQRTVSDRGLRQLLAADLGQPKL